MKQPTARILQEINLISNWLNDIEYNYHSINSLPINNKIVSSLIDKSKLFGVIWRQLFRVSPINLRSFFGQTTDKKDPKSMILLSLAYLELWNYNNSELYFERFKKCVNWIISNRATITDHFAIPQLKQILVSSYKADEKDISPFLTFWAGFLFLNAYEYLNDDYYLELAESVGKYFLEELPRIEDSDTLYFLYVPNHHKNVRCYNCSALISSYLLKLSIFSRNKVYSKYGKKGIQYIINVQNQDGSWYYGNNNSMRYIDNFHTSFMLFALNEANKCYESKELKRSIKIGFHYYKNHLFKKVSEGMYRPIHFDPRYLPHNSNLIQKVDLRDSALAIILFSFLSRKNPKYLKYANNVFNWTVKNMKGKIGFYPELTWFWPNKIPYIDFQAWFFYTLSIYLRLIGDEQK